MKCEEQTWQQKQIGLEASDLRERLLDSHYGMRLMTLLIGKCGVFSAATVSSLFSLLFSVHFVQKIFCICESFLCQL